jgi:hypothetical protein
MGVYDDKKIAEQVENAMRLALLHSRDARVSDADYKIKIDAFVKQLSEIRRSLESFKWAQKFFMEELKKMKQGTPNDQS